MRRESATAKKMDDDDSGPDYQPAINPACALLSFLYSLYCKEKVAKIFVKKFVTGRTNGTPSDTYLKAYRVGGNFPEVADVLISRIVPSNKPLAGKRANDPKARRKPSKDQATLIIPDIAYELSRLGTGKKTARAAADIPPITISKERPLLSLLAVVYVGHTGGYGAVMKKALADAPLRMSVKKKLLEIAKDKKRNGVPTVEQVLGLADELVKELTAPPTMW
jgi:hypothetical protein